VNSNTTVEIRRTPHSPNHIIRVTSREDGDLHRSETSVGETHRYGPPLEVLIDHAVERHHEDRAQQHINAWRSGR